MKSKKVFSIFILTIIFNACFLAHCSAQEAQEQPIVCLDPYLDIIEQRIEIVKQMPIFLDLQIWLAVMYADEPDKLKELDLEKFYQKNFMRKNNLKYNMEIINDYYRMSHGEVDKIKDKNFKETYLSIKNNNIEGLQGWYKDLASGVINEDKEMIYKAIKASADKNLIKGGDVLKKLTELVFIDLKNVKHGEVAAKEYVKDKIPDKYYVEMTFAKDSQAELNKIVRDIALFYLVRICNEPKLAERIQDPFLKEKSLDKSVKDIYDLWWK